MDNKIEQRRKTLMAARAKAIDQRDWQAMNEITKRLAKLPVKVGGNDGLRYATRIE